ncbi:hypothetical protein [Cryobacterium tagatosivorans]|uniref:Uncharacterized protein n=1 Tax=Cryobacterium tagatosivorans TaxID=1259199 RepID=A0A4R8UGI0_9MICO|nr:hypothetical protein [Cryobacterium tagatosivorans]TFB51982.1 hypothetical protein E3O23_07305 [Cryobacterium tagatosivorans]
MLHFALLFPLVVVVAMIALAVARRGPFRALHISSAAAASAEATNRRLRLRNVGAIAATVACATLLTVAGLIGSITTERQEPLDALHLLLLTPILTAVTAVAFFAFLPAFPEESASRTADLTRRTPLTFGPRSVFVAPVAAAALLAFLIVLLGAVADPDGRMLSYSPDVAKMGGGGGTFPGLVYGIPLLVGMVLLAGVLIVALKRIASAPRPTDASLREADSTVRLLGIRVVTKTATSALLVTAGSVCILAGNTAESINRGTSVDGRGNPIPADATMQAIGTLGTIALWLGVALVAAAIAFVVGAIGDATRKPFEIAPVAEVLA